VAQALNLGFYIALARLLSPDEFGQFAAATVAIGLALLVTESGLAAAVIHRPDRIDEAASTAVVATAVTGIGFSLVALATAPLVGAFFDSDDVTILAAASAGTVFVRTIATVPDALLQREFSFLRRLVIEPAQVFAFGVTAVVAAASGLGAWSLVVGRYVGFTLDAVLAWALVRWRPKRSQVSFSMWRELASYGRHVFVATAILRVSDQVNSGLIGRLLGTSALGQFRYTMRLASTPFSVLLAGAAYVLFPAFARIADDRERLQAAFLRSLRWVCVASFPAGVVFLALGVPIAVVAFGPVWRPAGEALQAACLLPAGGMLASVVSEALKAVGQPRLLTRMHLVTSLVTIGFVVALHSMGLTAAAAGISIGAMAGGAYALLLMRGAVGTPLRAMLTEIWPPAVASVIAGLAVLGLELGVVDAESHRTAVAVLLLAAEITAGGLVYLMALRVIAPDTARALTGGIGRALRRVARFRGPDPPTPEPEILDETLAP
jgi:PST family polysaccharide transporter